jgi:hypothetical protein
MPHIQLRVTYACCKLNYLLMNLGQGLIYLDGVIDLRGNPKVGCGQPQYGRFTAKCDFNISLKTQLMITNVSNNLAAWRACKHVTGIATLPCIWTMHSPTVAHCCHLDLD